MTTARYTDITLLNGVKTPTTTQRHRRRLIDRLRYQHGQRRALSAEFVDELVAAGIDPQRFTHSTKGQRTDGLPRNERAYTSKKAQRQKYNEARKEKRRLAAKPRAEALLLSFDPAAEFLTKKAITRALPVVPAEAAETRYADALRAVFERDAQVEAILAASPQVPASRRALLVTEPGYVAALEDVLALVQNELTRQGATQAPPIEQSTSAEACADCQKMAKECVDRIQYKLDELRRENSDLRKIIRYRESTIRSLKATASRRIERTKQVDRDMAAAHKGEIAGYRAHIDRLRLALAAHTQGVQE